MKKIFMLLLSIGVVSFSFAQSNSYRNDNDFAFRKGYDHHESFEGREAMFRRINHEFDEKIFAIEHDRTLSRHQKKVAIRALEHARKHEIRRASERVHHYRRDFDER